MNKHIGSKFSFLGEEGVREEVNLRAKRKILADPDKAERSVARRVRLAAPVVDRPEDVE
jgi:hypothetical protein